MCSEEAIEEIEALTAILEEDKVDIVKEDDIIKEVIIHLTPLTASQEDKQYVSLNLVIKIDSEYPTCAPKLEVRNPRGLEDSAVTTLIKQMIQRCEEYVGCPVLFELIELGREFLSERNVPVCQCCICLNNIEEDDQFLKTECLHFFHRHCLGRYITSVKKDYEEEVKRIEQENKHSTIKPFTLCCPVCREVIDKSRYNEEELLASAEPVANSAELVISLGDDVKKLQQQMHKLFLKQKQNGGIIDLEEEGKKYLVLTGSSDDTAQAATELSPTEFNRPASRGAPSPSVATTTPPYQHQSPKHTNYPQKGKGNWKGGRGAGRNFVGGQENSRGKSHHQMRKIKSKGGGGADNEGGKGGSGGARKQQTSRDDRAKQL